MIDERVFLILEEYSNIERWLRRVRVKGVIDPGGRRWDIGSESKAPCGCPSQMGGLKHRQYWYCERHPENGILFCEYGENGQFFWTDGKLKEVTR